MLVKSTLHFPTAEIKYLGINQETAKEVNNGLVSASEKETANENKQTIQTNSNNQNLSFVEKLKKFVTEKPLQAIGITIALGLALGAIIGKKMFNGKKAW